MLVCVVSGSNLVGVRLVRRGHTSRSSAPEDIKPLAGVLLLFREAPLLLL